MGLAFYTRRQEEEDRKKGKKSGGYETPESIAEWNRKNSGPSTFERINSILQGGVDTGKSVAKGVVENLENSGKGLGNLAYEMTGGLAKEEASQEESRKFYSKQKKDLIKKRDGAKDEAEKKRYQEALDKTIELEREGFKSAAENNKERTEALDPTKNAAAISGLFFDVATLGAGSAATQGAKGGAKVTSKEIAKRVAKQVAEGAGTAAVSGGLNELSTKGDEASASDIAKNAAISALFGAALTGAGSIKGVKNTKAANAAIDAKNAVADKALESVDDSAAKIVDEDNAAAFIDSITGNKQLALPEGQKVTKSLKSIEKELADIQSGKSNLSPEEKIARFKEIQDELPIAERNAQETGFTLGSQGDEVAPTQADEAISAITGEAPATSVAADVEPTPSLSAEAPRSLRSKVNMVSDSAESLKAPAGESKSFLERAKDKLTPMNEGGYISLGGVDRPRITTEDMNVLSDLQDVNLGNIKNDKTRIQIINDANEVAERLGIDVRTGSRSEINDRINSVLETRGLSAEDIGIQEELANRPANLRAIEQSTTDMPDAERLALAGGDTGQAGLMTDPATKASMMQRFKDALKMNEAGAIAIGPDANVAEDVGRGLDSARIDITPKTPELAKESLASQAKTSLNGAQRAQKTLGLDFERGRAVPDDSSMSAVEAGVKEIGERRKALDDFFEFAPELNKGDEAQKAIKVLTEGKAIKHTPKYELLDKYADTQGVASRYFGKQGSDAVYQLAEGAKLQSDIQEQVRPMLETINKDMKKVAKTKLGRTQINERVFNALNDRANAAQYFSDPKEREIFDNVAAVFDFFKDLRVKSGRSVIDENYAPWMRMKEEINAPENMVNQLQRAFNPNVEAATSKKRLATELTDDVDRNVIDNLMSYTSSQSKDLAYADAIDYMQKNLVDSSIPEIYKTDRAAVKRGQEYMQTLMKNVLNPAVPGPIEKFGNKILGNTYSNNLKFNPKFALQNMTQRFATLSETTKEGRRVAKLLDQDQLADIRKGLTSGSSQITSELEVTSKSPLGKADSLIDKFDPGQRVESKNVTGAFDRGFGTGIAESEPYKNAIAAGMDPKTALNLAMKDESVVEQAIRRGNVVVNDTQFGANIVNKPAAFREGGTILGIPKNFINQYKRFPVAMAQNIGNILRVKDAQAMDIMRRGNPMETKLVDYLNAAKALDSGSDDLIKAVKSGDVTDISLDFAKQYKDQVAKQVSILEKEIAKHSVIKRGKLASNYAKMWAAASAIQYLFDGGIGSDPEENKAGKAVLYGAPTNIPTKDQNPLVGLTLPSSPIRADGSINTDKALNLIPGVGLVNNRLKDIRRFQDMLTGGQ